MAITIIKEYTSKLDTGLTEKAIKFIKDTFERELASELRLTRITSTLFVPKDSGINDDLNGIERPVTFEVGNMNNLKMEVVQSLAKWKRMILADHKFRVGYGLYTDMNAIRPDDLIDNIHSIYVDQWDWELVMDSKNRNIAFLKNTVDKIFHAITRTAFLVSENYPSCVVNLPDKVKFISSSELLEKYPDLTPQEREYEITKKYGAVFIIGIGWPLSDGIKHGNRAPDYDDWLLNGDLIVWNDVLKDSLELSSMGIRVNEEVLLRQLDFSGMNERKNLYWHQRLLNGDFPQTIGGGIGQSRLCMFLLNKMHIGEVQASIWPEEDKIKAKKHGIVLM